MELGRIALQRCGVSLYEVAKRGNIAYSRVHDLANGKSVTATTLSRIIEACGFDVRLVQRTRLRRRKGR